MWVSNIFYVYDNYMLLSSIFEKYSIEGDREGKTVAYNHITKQYETDPQIANLLQLFRQVPSNSHPGSTVFITKDGRRVRDIFINKIHGGSFENLGKAEQKIPSDNQYRLLSFNIMNRHTVNTGNNKSSGLNLHGFQESSVIDDQWRFDRANKLLSVSFSSIITMIFGFIV